VAADPTWTTVLLGPQREPRFGSWCHRCGAGVASTFASTKVHRLAPRSRTEAGHLAPRSVVVPRCGPCGRRAVWSVPATMVLLAVPLVFVFPRVGAQLVRPLIDTSLTVRRLVAFVWVVALGWLAFRTWRFSAHFDAAFDGTWMRYSFRDSDRARAFAAANLGTIDGAPVPQERAQYEPDRDDCDHGRLDLDTEN
jgi:hypothetical protein